MYNTNTRFLYNADAPVASPAAAMAALSANPVQTETTTTETTASTEATPAANAEPAETAKVVAEAPAETPKPAAAPVITEKPWEEVLKSQKPEAIFKELGLDDKVVKLAQRLAKADPKIAAFLDTWENKGDVKSYLEALTTDYSKMAPEDVMRQNLRSQFPELDDEQFADLYAVKVTDRYKLDAENYTVDEVRRGKTELLADSKAIREALIAKQQEKLLSPSPEATVDPRVSEYEARQAQQVEGVANYKKSLTEDPYIKSVIAAKQITIGTGEEAFNLKIDSPEEALAFWHDPKAIVETMRTDGKDDFQKQTLIAAFAKDPLKFISELGKHYKTLGAKPIVDQLENASGPGDQTARAEVQAGSAAEAMAKNGRFVTR